MIKKIIDVETENGSQKSTYCDLFAKQFDQVNDQEVDRFFTNHANDGYDELKAGYLTMAELNQEIVHDFLSCDAECERRMLEQLP